jgi:hypothetical protein
VRVLARVLTREDKTHGGGKTDKTDKDHKQRDKSKQTPDRNEETPASEVVASGGPYVWNFEIWHECQTELL